MERFERLFFGWICFAPSLFPSLFLVIAVSGWAALLPVIAAIYGYRNADKIDTWLKERT